MSRSYLLGKRGTGSLPKAEVGGVISEERAFELIRAPHVTEKSTMIGEYNQVVFKVALDATKAEIKAAVEKLFKVKVKAVNTVLQKGKKVRFRGRPGKRSDMKKAFVTLADGHSLDVTAGV